MNATLWVTQFFLAAVFFYSGLMKSTKSERKLVAMGQTGVEGLPLPFIRFIGITELIGVVGLLLPTSLNYWPVLTPIAALCLGLIMPPAAFIHYRRGELKAVGFNAFVLLLCLLVAYGRWPA